MMNINVLSQMRVLSSSEETLEDWQDSPTNTTLRPKSHTLPKSQSLHEQLWEGIQKKSQDLLRGTGTLLNRSFSRDDPATQAQVGHVLTQAGQTLHFLHGIGFFKIGFTGFIHEIYFKWFNSKPLLSFSNEIIKRFILTLFYC